MARNDADDRVAALARLQMHCQPEVEPTLTQVELEAILDECKQAEFWTGETLYYAGDTVIPTTPNGNRYTCVIGGTSDDTEPEWPLNASTVTDGDELLWVTDGPSYKNVYNYQLAIYKAWMLKANKSVPEVDGTLSGGGAIGTFQSKCAQMYEHCVRQAQMYKPVEID